MPSVTEKIEYLCAQIPQLVALGLQEQAEDFAAQLIIALGKVPTALLFDSGSHVFDVTSMFQDSIPEDVADTKMKIVLIKQLRDDTGASLKAAKEFVEGPALEWIKKRTTI